MLVACVVALGVLAGCDTRVAQPSSGKKQEAPRPPIALTAPTDEQLAHRLTEIYAQVDGLQQVRVRSRAGVVHLSGTTRTIALEREAVDFAQRLEGVVHVDNAITMEAPLRERFAPTIRELRSVVRGALYILPQVIGALVVLVPFLLLARVLRRWRHPFHRLGVRRLTGHVIRSVLRGVILVIGVVVALEVLGLVPHVAGVIGTLGVLAIVASFAFRDWVRNYLPGLLLGLHPPFSTGDLVRIGDREGRVVRITPRATVLMTTDGEEVRIPNAVLYGESLVNYSHHRERRVRVEMVLSPAADLRAVRDLGRQALLELKGVMADPPPFMRVRSLERDAIGVEFFAWIDQDQVNFRTVESRARRAVFEVTAGRGVPLPEAVIELRFPSAKDEDDAEERDQAFLEQQVSRAKHASGERDLLEEGREVAVRPAAVTSPARES